MNQDQDDFDTAVARAKSRGEEMMREFYKMSREDKIPILAEMIYSCVELDPFGYPNGRPDFRELPDIDVDYKFGTDKTRYITAAIAVYNKIMWKPSDL